MWFSLNTEQGQSGSDTQTDRKWCWGEGGGRSAVGERVWTSWVGQRYLLSCVGSDEIWTWATYLVGSSRRHVGQESLCCIFLNYFFMWKVSVCVLCLCKEKVKKLADNSETPPPPCVLYFLFRAPSGASTLFLCLLLWEQNVRSGCRELHSVRSAADSPHWQQYLD